jgi:Transposase Tn5 dimerisation domain
VRPRSRLGANVDHEPGNVVEIGRRKTRALLAEHRLLEQFSKGGIDPEASCEGVLTPEQWQVLHQVVKKTPQVPASPPSLREAVRQIARLGGFLARKGDGEPGVKTIWRGLRRLDDFVTGSRLSRDHSAPKVAGNA